MPSAATPHPDRGALSGLLAGLSFIGGIGGANALADGPYPRPGASPSQISQYFTQNAGPTRLSAAGQAISAIALARFIPAGRFPGLIVSGIAGVRLAAGERPA